MRHDLLSDVLFVMNNAEKNGKKSCEVPASKLIKDVLEIIKNCGYIEGYEFIDDGRGGKFTIKLVGKINSSRAIRPRFSVKKGGYEKFEKKYLPAKDFGILIISTSQGVMSQRDAVKKGLGGKLIAYVY